MNEIDAILLRKCIAFDFDTVFTPEECEQIADWHMNRFVHVDLDDAYNIEGIVLSDEALMLLENQKPNLEQSQ